MAIACFRLVTFLPERPERSFPAFISRIDRSTFCCAFGPYVRAPLRLVAIAYSSPAVGPAVRIPHSRAANDICAGSRVYSGARKGGAQSDETTRRRDAEYVEPRVRGDRRARGRGNAPSGRLLDPEGALCRRLARRLRRRSARLACGVARRLERALARVHR